jgi:predicted NAD-dependent protein-ADP-ribosyltransferase YbiA (DUF1768 family)
MSEKRLLENSIINFFNNKKEYRSLSNFWECEVFVTHGEEGRLYESGEHCFHGEKYIRLSKLCECENRKKILFEYGCKFISPCVYKKGSDVKKMGGKKGLKLSDAELSLWADLSVNVQIEICKYKIEKYEEVRNDLIKSGVKILVHPALRCSEEKLKDRLWEGKGVVIDGKVVVVGNNRLGNIWMGLRNEIN